MSNVMDNTRVIKFFIRRFNPEKDEKPYFKEYDVSVRRGMTVLEGLHQIKEGMDQTLSYRFSCRMGVCGSCAMLINGKPSLACNTQILNVAQDRLILAPLPNFEIIKDLVPDLTPLFEKHKSVYPHIIRNEPHPAGEYFQSPDELVEYLQFSYCIKCGACMAACPTFASDEKFLGPMPLAQAFRYIADSRDDGYNKRKEVVDSSHGAFNCHFAGECSNVCPKGVDPAKAIQLLKRTLVFDFFKFLKKKKVAKPYVRPQNIKPKENIPKPPAYTVPQK